MSSDRRDTSKVVSKHPESEGFAAHSSLIVFSACLLAGAEVDPDPNFHDNQSELIPSYPRETVLLSRFRFHYFMRTTFVRTTWRTADSASPVNCFQLGADLERRV